MVQELIDSSEVPHYKYFQRYVQLDHFFFTQLMYVAFLSQGCQFLSCTTVCDTSQQHVPLQKLLSYDNFSDITCLGPSQNYAMARGGRGSAILLHIVTCIIRRIFHSLRRLLFLKHSDSGASMSVILFAVTFKDILASFYITFPF